MGSGCYEMRDLQADHRDGWREQPDHWLAGPTRGRLRGRTKRLKCGWPAPSIFTPACCARSGPSIDAHRHSMRLVRSSATAEKLSTRCDCGRTATPDYFDFNGSAAAALSALWPDALGRNADTRALPGRLDFTRQGVAFPAAVIALVACTLADAIPASARPATTGSRCPAKVAIQLNAHPDARGSRVDADPPRRSAARMGQAWDLTQRTLSYTNHTLLLERSRNGRCRGSRCCCRGSSRIM